MIRIPGSWPTVETRAQPKVLDMERPVTKRRQAEGIVVARRKGDCREPPPKIDLDEIRARIAEGQSPIGIARKMGISRGAAYKAKGMAGESGKAVQGPLEVREDPVSQASRTPRSVRCVFFNKHVDLDVALEGLHNVVRSGKAESAQIVDRDRDARISPLPQSCLETVAADAAHLRMLPLRYACGRTPLPGSHRPVFGLYPPSSSGIGEKPLADLRLRKPASRVSGDPFQSSAQVVQFDDTVFRHPVEQP